MRGYGKGSAQGGAGEDGWDGRAGCAVGDETRDRPPPPRHRQPLNHSSATRGTRGGRSRSSSRSDASRRPRPPTATPHRPPPAAAGRHDRLPPLPQRCPRVAHHPPPPGARPSRRRPAGACAPWHTPTRGERGERPTVAASPPHPAGASVDGGKRGGGGGGGRQPRQTKETCAGSWHAGGGRWGRRPGRVVAPPLPGQQARPGRVPTSGCGTAVPGDSRGERTGEDWAGSWHGEACGSGQDRSLGSAVTQTVGPCRSSVGARTQVGLLLLRGDPRGRQVDLLVVWMAGLSLFEC